MFNPQPKPEKKVKNKAHRLKKTNVDTEDKRTTLELINAQIEDVGYTYCEICGKTGRVQGHHLIFRSEKPKHPFLHDKRNKVLVCGTDTTGCHGDAHRDKGWRNEIVEERKLYLLFGEDVRNK